MKITLLDVYLDFEYIKNHYRLIAVDLSRQKELDADTKAIRWTIKKLYIDNNNIAESMFVLTILEKIRETRLKFFSCKCSSIIKDGK